MTQKYSKLQPEQLQLVLKLKTNLQTFKNV